MRKLKIIEHISLDGVIQAPGGPTEDGDYPHGGWTVPHRDPAVGGAILAEHAKSFDLLLHTGRTFADRVLLRHGSVSQYRSPERESEAAPINPLKSASVRLPVEGATLG